MTEHSLSEKHVWQVIGATVLGASHSRSGMPNQDAIGWLPDSGKGPPLILVIADGHGSQKHTHSDRGSRFAVEIATSLLREFLDKNREANLPNIQKSAENELPNWMEREWKRRVDEDIRNRPADGTNSSINSELAITAVTEGVLSTQCEIDPKRFVPYGSTLLAVAVADNFILYMQLGDGDILTVSPTGAVSRILSKDERLIANETTSLCLPRAGDYFRIHLQNIVDLSLDQIPALILVATDGYANSFQEEAGFFKAGKDYLKAIRSDGLDKVGGALQKWLEETSLQGSGDDITVGIIKREENEDTVRRLNEAEGRLNEAEGRLNEAEGRLSEAEGRLSEAEGRLSEAEGRSNETEGNKQLIRSFSRLKWSMIGIYFLFLAGIGLVLGNIFGYQQHAVLQGKTANPKNHGGTPELILSPILNKSQPTQIPASPESSKSTPAEPPVTESTDRDKSLAKEASVNKKKSSPPSDPSTKNKSKQKPDH